MHLPTLRTFQVLVVVVVSACGAPKQCPRMGSTALTQSVDAGVVGWPGRGCLKVTYQALDMADVAALVTAMDAWSKPTCTAMCFSSPANAPRDTSGIQSLHVSRSALGPSTSYSTVSAINTTSGDIANAQILIDTNAVPNQREWLRLIGEAIGLNKVPGTNSVMGDSMTAALTPLDEQSVCTIAPKCE